MLSKTQYLITEIGEGCNLAGLHSKCPSSDPRRWHPSSFGRVLTDDTIVSVVTRSYLRYGFTGLWGFHYYCEPTLYADRLLRLVAAVREQVPHIRLALWTNGTIPCDLTLAGEFEQIWHTNYNRKQPCCTAMYCRLHTMGGGFDNRKDLERVESNPSPCNRIWSEFILDARGQHHPCCYDWTGQWSLGNVYDAGGFEALASKWQRFQESVGGKEMRKTVAQVCDTCGYRTQAMTGFCEESKARANAWRATQC